MATAPRQHIRQHTYAINETHSADLYEWCTSVVGEPTRYGTYVRVLTRFGPMMIQLFLSEGAILSVFGDLQLRLGWV